VAGVRAVFVLGFLSLVCRGCVYNVWPSLSGCVCTDIHSRIEFALRILVWMLRSSDDLLKIVFDRFPASFIPFRYSRCRMRDAEFVHVQDEHGKLLWCPCFGPFYAFCSFALAVSMLFNLECCSFRLGASASRGDR